ncbi:MAG: flagellar export chaperone FliS [Thermoleophilia bacterium]|nr:flagellar export chaperone FliS [Thermoleophilia bacterium]
MDLRQYTQRTVQTATPGQLVVMLYDGMIRFFTQARAAMESGDVQTMNERVGRGLAIVTELRCTLDMTQGELPERLAGIYDWCHDEVIDARLANDTARINQVIGMLADLRSAWAQVANTPRPQVAVNRPVVGVNLAG